MDARIALRNHLHTVRLKYARDASNDWSVKCTHLRYQPCAPLCLSNSASCEQVLPQTTTAGTDCYPACALARSLPVHGLNLCNINSRLCENKRSMPEGCNQALMHTALLGCRTLKTWSAYCRPRAECFTPRADPRTTGIHCTVDLASVRTGHPTRCRWAWASPPRPARGEPSSALVGRPASRSTL